MTRHGSRSSVLFSYAFLGTLLLLLAAPSALSAQSPTAPEHGRQYDRLLIQNVHIIDGNGTPITGPSNVVV
jgi:hypothetical protein